MLLKVTSLWEEHFVGSQGCWACCGPQHGAGWGVPSIPPIPPLCSIPPIPCSPRPIPHTGVPALTAAPPAHPSVCAAGAWSCTDAPCPEATFCPGDLVYAVGSCLRTCDNTELNGTCPGLADGCVCPPGTVFLVGAPWLCCPVRGWAPGGVGHWGPGGPGMGHGGALGRWSGEVGRWGAWCRSCGVLGSWGIGGVGHRDGCRGCGVLESWGIGGVGH